MGDISELLRLLYNITPIKPIEKVEFVHYRNKTKIKAMIWKPKGEGPFPLVVLDVGLQFRIWEIPLAPNIITRLGYAVLGTSYSRIEIAKGEVEDIISAIDYTYRNFSFLTRKTVLLGISMGGAIMLKIASCVGEKYNVVGVIAVASYCDLGRAYYYADYYINSSRKKSIRVKLLNLYRKYAYAKPWELPYEYLLRSPINYVKNIKCSVLFIHGKKDEIVTCDHSIELYYKMLHMKKKVDLKLVLGEGIHTPLYFTSMLKDLNFIGFVRTWIYIYRYLKKLLNSTNPKGRFPRV